MAVKTTPRDLRCPAWKSADGDTYHTTWRHYASNAWSRRYYCASCDAHYPYLINFAADPLERYSASSPLGPVLDDDPNDYHTVYVERVE